LTCCAGSTLAGPTIDASMSKSFAPFLIPFSTALNHGMPAILTTVTIVVVAANAARPARPATPASAAPPNALMVLRLSMRCLRCLAVCEILCKGQYQQLARSILVPLRTIDKAAHPSCRTGERLVEHGQ